MTGTVYGGQVKVSLVNCAPWSLLNISGEHPQGNLHSNTSSQALCLAATNHQLFQDVQLSFRALHFILYAE